MPILVAVITAVQSHDVRSWLGRSYLVGRYHRRVYSPLFFILVKPMHSSDP